MAPDRGDAPSPLAVVGPTASGKSALAHAVALEAGDVELVVVDALQVYRGMDVGTATPTPAARAAVRHHLLDLVEPHEDFSLVQHLAAARDVLADIAARGRRALLVGGTGLYVRALVDDLDVPGTFPDARAEVESEPDTTALHARLAALDPVAAARMEPTNRRRVVRALEVTIGAGRPFSAFGPGLEAHPPSPVTQVGLQVPLDVLDVRIEARFRTMLDDGLLDEVARLAARPEPLSRTARQAVGYAELLDHLAGRCSLEDAVAEAARRTRRLARRQIRWFRRDPRIRWIDVDDNAVPDPAAVLGDWR